MIPMSASTKKLRYLALVSHILLLLWVTVWQFTLVSERVYSTLFLALFYLLPLLLPLRGIVAGKPYTRAWANFVVLFYVIHGFTVVYAIPEERAYAIIELILATSMFTGCAGYARLRGRELGLGLTKLKEEMKAEKARFEVQEDKGN